MEESQSNGVVGDLLDQAGEAADRNNIDHIGGSISVGGASISIDIHFDDGPNFLDGAVSIGLDNPADLEDVMRGLFDIGSSSSFSIIEESHGSGEYSNIFVSNTSDAYLVLERAADDQTIEGSTSADNLNGQSGHDLIVGLAGNDSLRGGGDHDLVYGHEGGDSLYGDSGNDTLRGGDGDDELYGGAGDDFLRGGDGEDTVRGGSGNDTVLGAQHDDILRGDGGNDSISGNAGDDDVVGGSGNDTLKGGGGDDLLKGQTGDDDLGGGSGADTFIFGEGSGHDVIVDFDVAQSGEVIDLSQVSDISSWSDLSNNHLSQSGSDVLIQIDSSNSILLENVDQAALSANDFVF